MMCNVSEIFWAKNLVPVASLGFKKPMDTEFFTQNYRVLSFCVVMGLTEVPCERP